MDDFAELQRRLAGVKNVSELARASKLSRKHIQRIRDGRVSNTTLKTIRKIEDGLAAIDREPVAA